MGRKRKKKLSSSKVDIIIPVYGQLDLLEKCLDSIPNAISHTHNVIVVDDCTPDIGNNIKDLVISHGYKYVRSSKNMGFPKTVNRGARVGSGKYIFLLNSDVVLGKGSLDYLVDTYERDELIGVLGMKLLFPQEVDYGDQKIRPAGKIQHVGISFDINALPNHLFVGWSEDNPKPNEVYNVPAVTGAAFFTSRVLWNKFRGMDEVYGRGTFEDVDFCMKCIHAEGKFIAVDVRSVGTHYVGASSASDRAFDSKPFDLATNKNIFYNRWKEKLVWSDAILL